MKVFIICALTTFIVAVSSSPTGPSSIISAGSPSASLPAPSTTTTAKVAKSATTIASSAVNSTAALDVTSCAYARQREQNSKTKLPGRVIPECRPDGKYAALQCHGEAVGGGRFCQCWDPEGNIVRAPSKKVKSCECILQRHQMTNSRPRAIGAFIPQCEESGHFKKHQCHGSTGHCWCVHPTNGTQIGEKSRGLAAESCV